MYAIDPSTTDSCIRDHGDRTYFRVDPECMDWAEYVGLQQHARKHSRSDLSGIYGAVVLPVGSRNLLRRYDSMEVFWRRKATLPSVQERVDGQMTKLQIIARLWSHITDLRMILHRHSAKTIEQIEKEIDITEYHCRRYADADDID